MASPTPRHTAALIVGWAALTVLVYAPSLSHEFLNWDDPNYIGANPEMQMAWPEAVTSMFTTFHFANYNPLHRLSLYVDWHLSGGDALMFRIVNLAWHVLNTSLLYFVLRAWLTTPAAAILGASLFVVLTPNVENVAWISERKTLIATAFALGALWSWLRDRPGLALASFGIGLFAKTSIVVLPGLLLLLDLQARRPLRWRLHAAFAIPAIVMSAVQILATSGSATIGLHGLHGGNVLSHAATIVGVLPSYLANAALPFGHLPRHLFEPVVSASDGRLFLGLGLWAGIAYGLWRSWRGERRFLVAGGFALMAIHVTLIVPIPIILADRYLYLATTLLLGLAADAFLRMQFRIPVPTRRLVQFAGAAAGITLIAGTSMYAAAWRDSTSLWTYAITHQPQDRDAWVSLAQARVAANDPRGAHRLYRSLLERHPDFAEAAENLAMLEVQSGETKAAAARLQRVVARDPKRGPAWSTLAIALALQGEVEKARATFEQGLHYCPQNLLLARNYAQFHVRRGQRRAAVAVLQRFVSKNPHDEAAKRAMRELAAPAR